MEIPMQESNCVLPNLECLNNISQLLVEQEIELLEVVSGIETNNKYTIKNDRGEKILNAIEENDFCTRMCLGSRRPFDIKILDTSGNEIIHLFRGFVCCNCCLFPCCMQKLEVYSPPGDLIGTVEQTWSFCSPKFDIKNENGNTIFKIRGPVCLSNCFGDIEFKILSLDTSTVVGKISKKWAGLVQEMYTDADNFGITFPIDLNVRMKAVLMSACFLIDFMYFENNGGQRARRR